MSNKTLKARQELEQIARECGVTPYVNRHYPDKLTMAFGPDAWEAFCKALAEQPAQQEPVSFLDWYDNAHWGNEDFKDGCRRAWYAALDYASPQPAPVQGWKLVPYALTPEMSHIVETEMEGRDFSHFWRDLLNAAPQPAQQEPEHIVHSNGRYSPLLTRMMNERVKSNVKQVIELYDSPDQPAQQEPVAWGIIATNTGRICQVELDAAEVEGHNLKHIVPLYTSPSAQQEPIAWIERDMQCDDFDPDSVTCQKPDIAAEGWEWVPLYTSPPAQPTPTKCWKCGDADPAFTDVCQVPACGMREAP